MAERRGNGLQSRVHGFKSRLHLARSLNGFGEPTRDEFNVGGVSLKFNNGDVVNLGFDQTSTHDVDERARSDALLEAVRRYTKL